MSFSDFFEAIGAVATLATFIGNFVPGKVGETIRRFGFDLRRRI